MHSIMNRRSSSSRLAALAFATTLAGCSVSDQTAPPLAGPSEFGLSITAVASPDSIVRDGSAQSVVTVTTRDATGSPKPGERIGVRLLTLTRATLSTTEVTTGSDGRATFAVIAPPNTVAGDRITIGLTPSAGDFGNVAMRTFEINVTPSNPNPPNAAFTNTPAVSIIGEVVLFDASATTDEGVTCGNDCTYVWNFGDGSAEETGRIKSHAFSSAGNQIVTLTVADAIGATGTRTAIVNVAAPAPPVADFTASVVVLDVFFSASGSTVGAGATITDYSWTFGDGSPTQSTGTTPAVTHTYASNGAKTVTLTITDSLGRKATKAAQVTIP